MEKKPHVVRLLKNHLYSTYQLHAQMANSKTSPEHGLRIGALTVMHWLCSRLGENVPDALRELPPIEDYAKLTDEALPSLYINQGYVVNIVSLLPQGTWSLQITEPDLGSDPGNPEQSRSAVPGRIIETNIAFRISGSALECGFNIVISDPDGTAEQAEVYRPAVVRQLLRNEKFGLKQSFPLTESFDTVAGAADCKTLLSLCRAAENQLPFVVFTERSISAVSPAAPIPPMKLTAQLHSGPVFPVIPAPLAAATAERGKITYDIARFATSCVTFAKVFLLKAAQTEKFRSLTGAQFAPGDILLLEPPCYGGGITVIPTKDSERRQTETLDQLKQQLFNYHRGRDFSYGHIAFLTAAREDLLHRTEEALRRSDSLSEAHQQMLEEVNNRWSGILAAKEQELAALNDKLDRLNTHFAELEQQKADLRTEAADAERIQNTALEELRAENCCLRRRLDRPQTHAEIAAWVSRHFAGRLLLHPRAIGELADKSARICNLDLICDALDYLATDYWETRYGALPQEEALVRCSEKYGRPFDVTHTGTHTIDFYPVEYKIKYFLSFKGKPMESALDYHLRVGNDAENLLRIYFLHDDDKKLVVVGSLPKHLPAVSIS